MDNRSNRAEYRLCLELYLDAIRRVFDLHAYYAHRHNNRIGQNGKPRQTEESDGVFVVHIESNDTENEEKDGEGQSNSVQITDSTDVVAVANWCS